MTADFSAHASAGSITIACLHGDDAIPASITSLDAGGIVRVSLECELAEGMRIQVHAGPEYSAAATVLYSVGSERQHFATIQIDQDERRREPRIAVDTKARVVVFHDLKTAIDARVTDVSKSGLALMTDQPIPCDALVKVVLDGAIVFAQTRHCRQIDETIPSYKVGVEIQAVILDGEAEPDWRHTPKELWGSLAVAVRTFQGQ